ncbi:MAG: DNA translocase FtsK 4TM domain-containing protein [Sulfurovaceae bacterium]|nr:DNA translocase FtsK 4TM domain-containing protein [Sulfurovaceae bacterium]
MVGNIGRVYGEVNLELFGYLAYIDLLLILYPLYLLYNNKDLFRRSDFYVGWVLLFISLIVFQTLIFEFHQSGSVGVTLKLFLLPYIGKVGLWLFWLLIFMISSVLIMDEIPTTQSIKRKFTTIYEYIAEKIEKLFEGVDNPFWDKESTEVMTTIVSSQHGRKKQDKRVVPRTPKKILHKKKKVKKSTSSLGLENRDDDFFAERAIEDIDKIASDYDEDIKEDRVPEENIKPKERSSKQKPKVIKESTPNIIDELKENRKLMDELEKGKIEKPKDFILPYLKFLKEAPKASRKINEDEIDRKVHELLEKLGQFKISGEVMDIYSGPLVTTFEFKPAANVKVSKIMNLQDDLAMALRAETIRIQAPIPGRDVVGIEIPNENFDTIYLRDILESEIFTTSKSPLTMALGKDIVGNAFVTDLKKLPHLLIAGTTGSGKSVGINAMILSLLYRNDPDSLKLMLIDPKMLEFSIYNDIPHLITPVITDATKAIAALANMVGEMERRYKMMAENRTKNIDNYNEKIVKRGGTPMPFIVVVIDELADLMMNGGKDVEYSIARLAQMARASGIHLIVATQRPSVDVVTGLIKANLPSRLSYRVGQRIDSKVILDALGADSLLGRGDALFTPPGTNGLVRIHAPWNSEDEVEEIVEFLKAQRAPDYDERYLSNDDSSAMVGKGVVGELDELYEDAKEVILVDQKTSISYLQRKLQIGYNRSANIIEQLQEMGVLSAPNNKGQRDILL